MHVLPSLAAGSLTALVALVPAGAASAHAVGGCPTPAGFTAVQLGDIPEIPPEFFAQLDLNGDGTICARPFTSLPNGGPPHKDHGGIAIDNTVVGLAP